MMGQAKWEMNRAGLLNFWYYDEETFHFRDGKLLLRGTNGSGKSVTMQSFLPVLLDGKKSPDRLDPFGSKARKMEDYLLGEKEVSGRDERTGYLYIEYKMQGSEQYVTTGIGMQAKRGKTLKSWYFIINDNRRVGHDFELAHSHGDGKVPFSAKELENRIGQGGYVVGSQREYMELVNKHVFGFQSAEAYEDLIKLLIQLRSPKLSKDFKPTVIYEILEAALPPLTDDELRHLSDTIENMDQASQQLEQLEREAQSIQRLENVYQLYNKYILAERARQWETADQRYENASAEVKKLERYLEESRVQIQEMESSKISFENQKNLMEQERKLLQNHEVWKLEETKSEKKQAAGNLREEISRLAEKYKKLNGKYHEAWRTKEKLELELAEQQGQERELLAELSLDAEEAAFHQHEVNVKDYQRFESADYDFAVWKKEAKEHRTLLEGLEKLAIEEERLKQEQMKLQRDSSDKKALLDGHQKDLDHLNAWFDSQQRELEQDIFRWMEEHQELQYSSESRQEIARAIHGLYSENRYDLVRDKLLASIQDYEADAKANIEKVKGQIEEKNAVIEETKDFLHQLKNQKMIDPARAEGTKAHRVSLQEKGAAFIPFHAAVEFKEHVTDEQRDRIESALKVTGLLDSLITNDSFTPEEDAVLHAEPRLLGYTLADYLMPDLEDGSPISNTLVDEVLRSIPLEREAGGFSLDVDGTYSVGCLVGHAPREGASKFIGRTSRKRHQREQIQEWTEKLNQHMEELSSLTNLLYFYQENLKNAVTWKQELPQDHLLADLHDQVLQKKQEINKEKELLQRIDDEWKKIIEQHGRVKGNLRERGIHLNIDLQKAVIEEALKFANSYEAYLNNLSQTALTLRHIMANLASTAEKLTELEEDVDSVKGEQNVKESRQKQLQREIESIEEQLKLEGIDQVRERIQTVQRLLKEAEEQLRQLLEQLPQKRADEGRGLEKLEEANQRLSFWRNMAAACKTQADEEMKRGFVGAEPDYASILKLYGDLLAKHDRAKLLEQLTKAFINEQIHLTEYRMFDYTESMDEPDWFREGLDDHFQPFINEWHQLKSRRLIQLDYHGQRVSPDYVAKALQAELADQRSWLDEQDRQLYEDIIVNSVGRILRNRIQRAQQWVKEMDKIMSERDNSSGLIFSIAWKPLTAESENEIDTGELVKLLQRNSKFLSEEDLNKITGHFQSRIEKAKELIQLRNEGSTLHQVLKEVLDYRKWFTFVLSFRRENEPKRELTNNAFFKFSGGEKAMAMYIPLFTAAFSRYKEADGAAPYIISLDEAFAGVDENNIRDMFEVVEQLGFNYIMNSQALWGDYDTISSLSIAELVRPKNADYVTVIRYEWDGRQKSLMIDDHIPSEELVGHEG